MINCGGLQCDRVSRKAGSGERSKIVPFRGEYYMIKSERQFLVNNLIYPVPDPKFPFLGVHFTRLIHGGREAGPNAVLAFKREGYRQTDFSLRDTIETLTYPGFWRFFVRYPKMCWDELRRSYSKELFCRSLQRLVPESTHRGSVSGRCGSSCAIAQTRWRTGTGFPVWAASGSAACVKCAEPRGDRITGNCG